MIIVHVKKSATSPPNRKIILPILTDLVQVVQDS